LLGGCLNHFKYKIFGDCWIFKHIFGTMGWNTMIGATKCMDITKELYPYIFESSQKEHNNFNCQIVFRNMFNYYKVSILKFDSNSWCFKNPF
jgi:hypothetical protein